MTENIQSIAPNVDLYTDVDLLETLVTLTSDPELLTTNSSTLACDMAFGAVEPAFTLFTKATMVSKFDQLAAIVGNVLQVVR